MPRLSSRFLVAAASAAFALAAGLAGCGGSQAMSNPNSGVGGGAKSDDQNPSAPPAPIEVDPALCEAKGKRVAKYDINRDNRADVWEYYASSTDPQTGEKTEHLTCKMVDLNFDGKVDMTQFFNDKNERILEMLDLDFDGKPDEWVYYAGGVKIRTAIDTDFDGKPDTWRIYDPKKTGSDAQRLVRVERATKDPDKVDYWEFWNDGQLERIGYDTTGDGQIDKWETASDSSASAPASAPAPAPARAAAAAPVAKPTARRP